MGEENNLEDMEPTKGKHETKEKKLKLDEEEEEIETGGHEERPQSMDENKEELKVERPEAEHMVKGKKTKEDEKEDLNATVVEGKKHEEDEKEDMNATVVEGKKAAGLQVEEGEKGKPVCCLCHDNTISWSKDHSCSHCNGEVDAKLRPDPAECRNEENGDSQKCVSHCAAELNGEGTRLMEY